MPSGPLPWGESGLVSPYPDDVSVTVAALLGGVIGLVLGAVGVAAARLSQHVMTTPSASAPAAALPPGAGDVLAVLPSVAVVLDSSDAVVNTSPSAVAYGLVRGRSLVHPQLLDLVRAVRRDGEIREVDLELPRGGRGAGSSSMRIRVAPLGRHVLVLADDHTHERRVEEIRRDFVANVSHELKTPVGGISLLAEAIRDAKDDPDAVARFAERIQNESTRLGRLVQDIVQFSRLQAADTDHAPQRVDVRAVVHEALERTRTTAEAKGTQVVESVPSEPVEVFGDAELLVTAVSNLVTNAVNYSEPETRVIVAVRADGAEDAETVRISVADQGSGIPAEEQDRIFERFYRVDPARSRATGGTGLGLAIVKHICHNHGGEVSVWSQVGQGSTFTITLPTADGVSSGHAPPAAPAPAQDRAPARSRRN